MDEDTRITGQVLRGRYRPVRRVAAGVPTRYEVTHPHLAGRFMAALWPPSARCKDLRRGAALASTLRHRGMVQLIDFNCREGAPLCMIHEWVEGRKLSAIMAESGRIPAPRVAALVENMAVALAAAHAQGIVHGQLRPEEITVVESAGGAREWTKLEGLAVADALVGAGFWPPSRYRAPEQAASDVEAAGPPSDQYALAAIAYEMLTGAPASSLDEAAAPGSPSALDRAFPLAGAVEMVLRQALAADPRERFGDVLEFARTLRRAVEAAAAPVARRRDLASETRSLVRVERSPRVTGRLRALVRFVPALPVGAPARLGLALALWMVIFGGALLALHGPSRTLARTRALAPQAGPRPPVQIDQVALAARSTGPVIEQIVARAPDVTPIPTRAVVSRHARPPRSRKRPKTARSSTLALADSRAADNGRGLCLMSVESTPSHARVVLDGRDTGHRTPLTAYRVPCGEHKLLVRRDDLKTSRTEPFNVSPGAPLRSELALR